MVKAFLSVDGLHSKKESRPLSTWSSLLQGQDLFSTTQALLHPALASSSTQNASFPSSVLVLLPPQYLFFLYPTTTHPPALPNPHYPKLILSYNNLIRGLMEISIAIYPHFESMVKSIGFFEWHG